MTYFSQTVIDGPLCSHKLINLFIIGERKERLKACRLMVGFSSFLLTWACTSNVIALRSSFLTSY